MCPVNGDVRIPKQAPQHQAFSGKIFAVIKGPLVSWLYYLGDEKLLQLSIRDLFIKKWNYQNPFWSNQDESTSSCHLLSSGSTDHCSMKVAIAENGMIDSLECYEYTPQDSQGTWEHGPPGKIIWTKPSFSDSMLIFGGVKIWFSHEVL